VCIGCMNAAFPACSTVRGFAEEALKAFGYYSLSEQNSPNLGTQEKIIIPSNQWEIRQKWHNLIFQSPLALLGKYVHSLQEEQLVVLCIDNFDALTQRKEFDRSFFEAVRAMAQR